jgi:hypothetical protein
MVQAVLRRHRERGQVQPVDDDLGAGNPYDAPLCE